MWKCRCYLWTWYPVEEKIVLQQVIGLGFWHMKKANLQKMFGGEDRLFFCLSGKPWQGFSVIHLNRPSCSVAFVSLCFYIIHDSFIWVISFDSQKLIIHDFLILALCSILGFFFSQKGGGGFETTEHFRIFPFIYIDFGEQKEELQNAIVTTYKGKVLW